MVRKIAAIPELAATDATPPSRAVIFFSSASSSGWPILAYIKSALSRSKRAATSAAL
jgi:hypothetical protein